MMSTVVLIIVGLAFGWPSRQAPFRTWPGSESRVQLAPRRRLPQPITGVITVSVVGLAVGSPLLATVSPILGVAGWRERSRYLDRVGERRRAKVMVDFVEAATAGLRAGGSLDSAVHDALRQERDGLPDHPGLQKVFAGLSAGRSLIDAFADTFGLAGVRKPEDASADDRLVATTIEALGASGVAGLDALERVGDTLRERTASAEELRTQAQQAISSAAVMSALPVVFGVAAAVAEPEVSELYRTRWLGALCVGSALICSVAGWEWQRRLIGGRR